FRLIQLPEYPCIFPNVSLYFSAPSRCLKSLPLRIIDPASMCPVLSSSSPNSFKTSGSSMDSVTPYLPLCSILKRGVLPLSSKIRTKSYSDSPDSPPVPNKLVVFNVEASKLPNSSPLSLTTRTHPVDSPNLKPAPALPNSESLNHTSSPSSLLTSI